MKNWSTLQKGDKLYLLVPISTYNTDGTHITKYVYQESSVINVHQYENHINIRFKYTDANGKRRRIELSVNKLKFNNECVSSDKRTGWASNYNPLYGDLIVTYINKEKLNNIYSQIVKQEINKYEEIIENNKKITRQLKSIQYDSF